MIRFFVDGEPPHTTAQQRGERILKSKTTGKMFVHHYQKAKVADAERWFVTGIRPHADKDLAAPMSGPIRLEMVFVFNWKAAEFKRRAKRIAAGHDTDLCAWKPTAPDTDNMLKLAKDTLTAFRFWDNDGQICEEIVRKLWGDRPGVFIQISKLEEREAMPPCWWRAGP